MDKDVTNILFQQMPCEYYKNGILKVMPDTAFPPLIPQQTGGAFPCHIIMTE